MNIGKKILSAFVDVTEDVKTVAQPEVAATTLRGNGQPYPTDTSKFRQHFDHLFNEANIPGPDYYEFSKMIEAMAGIPDERARYTAAFAGLAVQGLDKQKLLATATEYLQLLEKDAVSFNQTLDRTRQEKVNGKKEEIEEKSKRIQLLSQEITDLHNAIAAMQNEIRENEVKIDNNSTGYQTELDGLKGRILADIDKIKEHIV